MSNLITAWKQSDGDPSNPHIFIPLYKQDSGSVVGRASRPEIANRNPHGVVWSPSQVAIEVRNWGKVGADAVRVSYLVTYIYFIVDVDSCSGKDSPVVRTEMMTENVIIPFIAPGASEFVLVDLREGYVDFIDLSCRAFDFFSPDIPEPQWSVLTDPAVADARSIRRKPIEI